MKKLLLATTIALTASASFAGGLSDPIVTPAISPDVIIEDTAASGGHDWIPPAFFLLFLLTFLNSTTPTPLS